MNVRRDRAVYHLTMTAAAAAALAVIAPWSVPLGPVPLSLCTALLYLVACLLKSGRAVAAAVVYVLLGAAGLPVYSGFMGGLGHLAGPTGGYIVGYIPLTAICALFVKEFPGRRWAYPVGMVLGTAVLYGMGTAWFCLQTNTGFGAALAVCTVPFLPGDLIKMLAAFLVGPALRDRLERSGLLRE